MFPPTLSAGALGRFRIAVGLCLLAILIAERPSPLPIALHRDYSLLADNALVHWLAANEPAWNAVLWIARAAALAFAVGLWARASYTILAVLLLFTRLAMLQSHGVHDWVAPMGIILALLIVPWGDGVSLDQRMRPPSGRIPPDTELTTYGFAVWVPGLVLGLAFAAAAFSKLWESGFAWITTGAVKYHFVEDAAAAPVSWGLWIAAHHSAAVAASAGAMFAEAGFILLAVSRRPIVRLLAMCVGASLFAGFFLFQGVLWWPWAMWLLAFLPWDGWRRREHWSVDRATPAQLTVVGSLVIAQLVASLARVEVEPLLSPYPMYSGTYASPAEYEAQRKRKFQRIQTDIDGRLVDIEGDDGDRLMSAVETVNAGGELSAADLEVVTRLCHIAATRQDHLVVHAERTTLDWTRPQVARAITTRRATLPCS